MRLKSVATVWSFISAHRRRLLVYICFALLAICTFVFWKIPDIHHHLHAAKFITCSMSNCFDVDRCSAVMQTSPASSTRKIPIYLYTRPELNKEYPMSTFYQAWLDFIREHHTVVDDPSQACLFVPAFDLSCPYNRCLGKPGWRPHETASLRSFPFWNGGRNHLIVEVSDWSWPMFNMALIPFHSDAAILLKSGCSRQAYRRGFDVSLPLTDVQRQPLGFDWRKESCPSPAWLTQTDMAKRDVLAFFKGALSTPFRQQLFKLHNPQGTGIVVVLSDDKQFDFKRTLARSKFGLAPAGHGIHSYRLMEVLAAGAIPVASTPEDNAVLPFADVIDWYEIAIIVKQADLKRLPSILSSIPIAKLIEMQRKGAVVYRTHFCNTQTMFASVFRQLTDRIVSAGASTSGR